VTYTPAGLLFQGSLALLYLAKDRGYPRDGLLQTVCYFPTEASYLVSASTHKAEDMGHEQAVERAWQEKNILSLEDKIFKEFGEPIEIPTSAQDTA
jgi:hypothetical protein